MKLQHLAAAEKGHVGRMLARRTSGAEVENQHWHLYLFQPGPAVKQNRQNVLWSNTLAETPVAGIRQADHPKGLSERTDPPRRLLSLNSAATLVERKMPPLTGTNLKNMQTLMRAAEKLNNPSLSMKIHWLQSHKSDDPLQQMQTDAIVDLYAAVKQIQEAIWPILLQIPDTSAVQDAAAGQAGPPTRSPAFSRVR